MKIRFGVVNAGIRHPAGFSALVIACIITIMFKVVFNVMLGGALVVAVVVFLLAFGTIRRISRRA